MIRFTLILLILHHICLNSICQAHLENKRHSKVGLSNYKKDEHYLKVTYGRPNLKSIYDNPFGNRIKYKKIWRLGDDEATELTVTKKVFIGEHELSPGTYSVFCIPDSTHWTIILNKNVGLWGTYKYRKSSDLFRIELPIYKSPKPIHSFTIYFEESSSSERDGADMLILWSRTAVRLPIYFEERKE